MNEKTTSIGSAPTETDDAGSHQFEDLIRSRVAEAAGPLFFVGDHEDVEYASLFDLFLSKLPANHRQYYNCHCCRRFINKYGRLVSIHPEGSLICLLWRHPDNIPEYFSDAVHAVRREVYNAPIRGVFISHEKVWGTPTSPARGPGLPIWTHLSGTPRPSLVYSNPIKSASQRSAELTEDYRTLQRALAEYNPIIVRKAVTILKSDALYRGEKTLGVAEWLQKLYRSIDEATGKSRKNNLVWLAIATAPPGFAHIKSSMIGTLLDDLKNDLPLNVVQEKFAEKMHPTKYRRPDAPPKDGAITQANKIVQELQSANALNRRFAKLEEVTALWKYQPPEKVNPFVGGETFDHLRRRRHPDPGMELPDKMMTWMKFSKEVMPIAHSIDLHVPVPRAPYVALVTAADPNAPPILQWDGLKDLPRNPVSWYLYDGDSHAAQWNLSPGSWNQVSAICLQPTHWQIDTFTHFGEGVFFLLQGCRDTRYERTGGLFPETLRQEYHSIRSVIEAYSREAVITGKDEATACGIMMSKNGSGGIRLRVRIGPDLHHFILDRWD